jgi:hypothetical protein
MPEGYLYILYHNSFEQYGSNVYKFGLSINLDQRLRSYTTSYLDKAKYLYTSARFRDCYKAEKVLFALCDQERIQRNREFFKIDLEKAISIIQNLEQLDAEELNRIFNKVYNNMLLQDDKYKLRGEEHKMRKVTVEGPLQTFDSAFDLLEHFKYRPGSKTDVSQVKLKKSKVVSYKEEESESSEDDNE